VANDGILTVVLALDNVEIHYKSQRRLSLEILVQSLGAGYQARWTYPCPVFGVAHVTQA
jgi:hypothetical protein